MAQPLYVAFVWHMHQPFYKDPLTGRYFLPWVRLHAVKDYLHMAEILQEFPRVHVTFNLVPSLVEQVLEYAAGEAVDRCLALSRKEVWNSEERAFLLSFFFHIHWDRVIRTIPRYRQLLDLRQQAQDDPDLLSEVYYRDLVAWFNLAWIDPNWRERHPDLRRLVEKGKGFTPQEVARILEVQGEILSRMVPTYRALQEKGQIEITTSPYHHPILPLLIHTDLASRASPGLPVPRPPFAHPEDAEEQLRRAVAFHTQTFGQPPRGLWPSEGAVCREMLPMVARLGFRWLASDEGVLARSLGTEISRDGYGHVTNPRVLYRPYRTRAGPSSPAIVFRDHVLSDRIGFVYQHMEGRQAAEDLIGRLHRIRENLSDPEGAYLVAIILDGENCWEGYEHNGDVFLRHLYGRIQEDEALQAVTVSEFLQRFPPTEEIADLATGSWIGANLETWIGEPAQNRAWECLRRTRERLIAWQRQTPDADVALLEQAWQELYIAEGSDWFWWYYSRNNPAGENLFDREFRRHLGNVYRLLGLPVPAWLREPIPTAIPEAIRRQTPQALISPPLAAGSAPAPGWTGAGYVEPQTSTGAMQRAALGFRRLWYGFDQRNLYLRLEVSPTAVGQGVRPVLYLATSAGEPGGRIPFAFLPGEVETPDLAPAWAVSFAVDGSPPQLLKAVGQENWQPVSSLPHATDKGVWEVAVPLAALGVQWGETVTLFAVLVRDGVVVEALPQSAPLEVYLAEP